MVQTETKEDWSDLLPHFDTKLAMELHQHLRDRIRGTCDILAQCERYQIEDLDDLASQIVGRMYRTQMKEARAILSFSDAVVAYNRSSLEASIPQLPLRAAKKLRSIFGAKEKTT